MDQAWPDIIKESLDTYHQVLGDFIHGDIMPEASRRAEEQLQELEAIVNTDDAVPPILLNWTKSVLRKLVFDLRNQMLQQELVALQTGAYDQLPLDECISELVKHLQKAANSLQYLSNNPASEELQRALTQEIKLDLEASDQVCAEQESALSSTLEALRAIKARFQLILSYPSHEQLEELLQSVEYLIGNLQNLQTYEDENTGEVAPAGPGSLTTSSTDFTSWYQGN